MDTQQVLTLLRKRQGKGSLRKLAQELGFSPAYLSDVFLGRRAPGPRLLAKLGLERVEKRRIEVTYRRVRNG